MFSINLKHNKNTKLQCVTWIATFLIKLNLLKIRLYVFLTKKKNLMSFVLKIRWINNSEAKIIIIKNICIKVVANDR